MERQKTRDDEVNIQPQDLLHISCSHQDSVVLVLAKKTKQNKKKTMEQNKEPRGFISHQI